MITCNEAQRLIDPYLNKKISDRDLESFLDHIDHCPSCREELDISLKIRRVLEDVENDSSNNDYHDLLEQELKESRRHLKNVRLELRVYQIAAAVSILVLAVIIGQSVYERTMGTGWSLFTEFFSGQQNGDREQAVTGDYSETGSETVTENVSESLTRTDTGRLSEQSHAAKKTVASTAVREYSETLIDEPAITEADRTSIITVTDTGT